MFAWPAPKALLKATQVHEVRTTTMPIQNLIGFGERCRQHRTNPPERIVAYAEIGQIPFGEIVRGDYSLEVRSRQLV
jgi:hypothetical protein